MSIDVTDYASTELALYATEGGGCASALRPGLNPVLASWKPVEIMPRVWVCFPGEAGRGGDSSVSPCFRPAGCDGGESLFFDVCPTTDVWCKARTCLLAKGEDWGVCGP
jgi:hypothetical protein